LGSAEPPQFPGRITHAVATVVIDAGHTADRRAVREIDPSHHVHLPHLRRAGALQAPVVLGATPTWCRHDELVTHECAIDRRATRRVLAELVHQTLTPRRTCPKRYRITTRTSSTGLAASFSAATSTSSTWGIIRRSPLGRFCPRRTRLARKRITNT
jgi:hypothetical protein